MASEIEMVDTREVTIDIPNEPAISEAPPLTVATEEPRLQLPRHTRKVVALKKFFGAKLHLPRHSEMALKTFFGEKLQLPRHSEKVVALKKFFRAKHLRAKLLRSRRSTAEPHVLDAGVKGDEFGPIIHVKMVLDSVLIGIAIGSVLSPPGGFDGDGNAKLSILYAFSMYMYAFGLCGQFAAVSIMLHLAMLFSKKWKANSLLVDLNLFFTFSSLVSCIVGLFISMQLIQPYRAAFIDYTVSSISFYLVIFVLILIGDWRALKKFMMIVLAPVRAVWQLLQICNNYIKKCKIKLA